PSQSRMFTSGKFNVYASPFHHPLVLNPPPCRNDFTSNPSVGTIQARVSATTATFNPALETRAESRSVRCLGRRAGAEVVGVGTGVVTATLIAVTPRRGTGAG